MKRIWFIWLLIIIILISGCIFEPKTVTISQPTATQTLPAGTVTGIGFDSGVLNAEDTFIWTFKKAGSFFYTCSNHPNMIGIVVVT